MILSLMALLVLIITSCLAFFAASSFLVRPRNSEETALLASLSIGGGGLLIAWLFTLALFVFDGINFWILNAALAVAFLCMLAIGMPRFSTLTWRQAAWSIVGAGPFLIVAGGLLALYSVTVFALPFAQNDPLEYAAVARQVFEDQSLRNYPATDMASGSVYGPWTHPPAFVGLTVWLQSFVGDFDHAGLARLIPPYFALATFAVLIGVGGWWAGGLASLILITSFWYGHSVISAHLDPMRIFAITAAVVFAPKIGNSVRRAGFAGILCGLALFTHSTGILAVAVCGAVWIVTGKISVASLAAFAAGLLAVVGLWSLRNYQQFGSILTDSQAVWNLPELGFGELQRLERGLMEIPDQIWMGVLRGFSDTYGFGPWYYVALALLFVLGLVGLLFKKSILPQYRDALIASGMALMVWFAIAAGLTALGSDAAIRNARYAMTLQPMVALFVATILVVIAQRMGDRLNLSARRTAGVQLAGSLGIVAAIVTLGIGGPVISHLTGELSRFGFGARDIVSPSVLLEDDRGKALRQNWSLYQVIERAPDLVGDGCVLTMRYSDLVYYGNVCTINLLDPRMIPAYEAKNADDMERALKAVGVSFVLLSYSNRHLVDHTPLAEILSSRSELATFSADPIETWYLYRIGGATRGPGRPVGSYVCEESTGCTVSDGSSLEVDLAPPAAQRGVRIVGGNDPYQATIRLRGNGLVSLRLARDDGEFSNPFWRGMLTEDFPRELTLDVGLPDGTVYRPAVQVETTSNARVSIGSFDLTRSER